MQHDGESLKRSPRGVAPREDILRLAASKVHGLDRLLKSQETFEEIGISPTIELSDREMTQLMVRCTFSEPEHREKFLQEFQRKVDAGELIGVSYELFRASTVAILLVSFRDLAEFQVLLRQDWMSAARVEFHVLFRQVFWAPSLPPELRCRPCLDPITVSALGEETWEPDCGHCHRFVVPRGDADIYRLEFGRAKKEELHVDIVDVNLSLGAVLALTPALDQEEVAEQCLSRYEAFCRSKSSSSGYATAKEVRLDFERLHSIPGLRASYASRICQGVERAISKNSDLVVLPEYSLTDESLSRIKSLDSKGAECTVVAGSRLRGGANASAVIRFQPDGSKQVFEIPKRGPNQLEKALKLVTENGTAHLWFSGLSIGEAMVLICSDALTTRFPFLGLDHLIVPSFNVSSDLPEYLRSKVTECRMFSIYSNTSDREGVRSEFFAPAKAALNAAMEGVEEAGDSKAPRVDGAPLCGEIDESLIGDVEGIVVRHLCTSLNLGQLRARRALKAFADSR